MLQKIPFGWVLALFLFSALVGAGIAYAPENAARAFGFVGLGMLLYGAIVVQRGKPRFFEIAIASVSGAAAFLVVAFLVSEKFVPPARAFMHPNALAGIAAASLPPDLALAIHFARARAWFKTGILLCFAVMLIWGLAAFDSRGAWFALSIVGGAALAIYLARKFRFHQNRTVWAIAVLLGVGAFFALLYFQDNARALFVSAAQTNAAHYDGVPRELLYQQVWRVLQDYFFTGSGLGTFPMVYSTYALHIHVYLLPHAHNIFLQTWLEQGLLGIGALMWFVLAFYAHMFKTRAEWNWLAAGGLAATSVMLLHGMIDAPFWYADITRALFFLPFAFALAGVAAPSSRRAELKIGAGVAIALVVFVLWFGMPIVPRLYANVASLIQTRIELGPNASKDTWVEYTRRTANYADAEKIFGLALARDAQDVTSNQRMAIIEIARGDYDAARTFALAAFARDAGHPVTLQLLGEVYLGLGQDELAYAYWFQVADAVNKLRVLSQVRYQRRGDFARAARARALAERIERAH